MQKNRNYIVLILSVFLLCVGLGKWRQTAVLSHTGVTYQTELGNKKSGNTEVFQVTLLSSSKALVENVTKKTSFEGKIKQTSTGVSRAIRFVLPNDKGTLILKAGLLPWEKPKLEITNSTVYTQKNTRTQIVERQNKNETTTASQTDKSVVFSSDDIQNIRQKFGHWLYESQYAKDAVVVSGAFSKPQLKDTANSQVLYVSTKDGDILTSLLVTKGDSDWIREVPNPVGYNSESLSQEGFVRYVNHFDLAALGNSLGSDSASDYQAKTIFRIYHLKERKHAYYTEDAERLSLEKLTTGDLYESLFNNLMDTSQPSYQIVLASNGQVYWTKGYNLSSSLEGDKYELAPDDMQEAYQAFLGEYSK